MEGGAEVPDTFTARKIVEAIKRHSIEQLLVNRCPVCNCPTTVLCFDHAEMGACELVFSACACIGQCPQRRIALRVESAAEFLNACADLRFGAHFFPALRTLDTEFAVAISADQFKECVSVQECGAARC